MRRQIRSWFTLLLFIVCGLRCLRAVDNSASPDLMDMSIDQLMNVEIDSVYGASRYKQKVTEVPASITIVTAEEIQRYGYQTLADILRSVPGLYVTYDRDYSYVGFRGFGRSGDYNSRILLLIDGHRTNDNIFDGALLGTEFPLDIDLIDRVEVIRGPNSSLYTASAFLGVINVITKPVHKQNSLTASGELASYGTLKSRFTYGHSFSNGLDMILSATYYDSAGHDRLFFPDFASPSTNNGIAQNADYGEAHQVFANLTYGNFHLEGVFGSREKGIPTGSFGTLVDDPAARTVDGRGFLDLTYDRKFGSDWGVLARVYYDNYRYGGFYPQAPASPDSLSVLNTDLAQGQWWGAEVAMSKRLPGDQTLIVGSQFEDNFEQYQTNFNQQPFFQFFASRPTSTIWAAYAQDTISLRSNLTLHLGLRFDDYSTFGRTTNPRAAIIYQPWEKTTLKFLYGQSFRAPNAYELYYETVGQEQNPHLRPETVNTMEIVLEQVLPQDLRLLASTYDYPIHGLIDQGSDPSNGDIVYINSATIDLKGLELTLKKQSPAGLEAAVSVALQDADRDASNTLLTNSPRVLVQSNCSVPLFKRKLYASMNLDYVSRRRTNAGAVAGAYFLPDFTIFSKATRHVELSASLYNAFGTRYNDPASIGDPEDLIQQDGRTFRLKFAYHF